MNSELENSSGSPFHRGEQLIHERLGIKQQAEQLGRRMIHAELPDQHREFFQQLSYLVVGSVDDQARPWASMLAGLPGFVSSPDTNHLQLAGLPLEGDPLAANLRIGADVGLLGIDLASRRRNRANGRIESLDATGTGIRVSQAFGNCPQFIQQRSLLSPVEASPVSDRSPVTRGVALSDQQVQLAGRADTLFIASALTEDPEDPSQGVDVSHRGGKPGFVRVDGPRTLTIPDFSGNRHFNTVGNLLLNPRAGLLFVDFERGDLLSLTGRVEIIWEGAELASFEAAERLLKFELQEAVWLPGAIPHRWQLEGYARQLERTGSWA